MSWTWASVPRAVRTLGRWITIVQLVGYTTSLVFVWHTTRLVPAGVATRYRGEGAGLDSLDSGAMQRSSAST